MIDDGWGARGRWTRARAETAREIAKKNHRRGIARCARRTEVARARSGVNPRARVDSDAFAGFRLIRWARGGVDGRCWRARGRAGGGEGFGGGDGNRSGRLRSRAGWGDEGARARASEARR